MIISEPDPTEVMPTMTADDADRDRDQRSWLDLVDRTGPGLAGPPIKREPEHHRRRADEQSGAEDVLDVVRRGLGVSQEMQEVGAEEGGRNRPSGHQPDEA